MTAAATGRFTFRAWRRSRPFWGGLLLLLGGLEMLLIPLTGVLARGQIKLVIYVGIGGVFGILIGALLIACGLALWFTPVHKTFYAIAGVLLSLLSFIGTNLGGFFIGMLLGIVGGSLAFAWSPGLVTGDEATDDDPSGPGHTEGHTDRPSDDTDPDITGGPSRGEPPGPDWGLSAPRHRGGRRRSGQSSWSSSASRSLAVAALLAVAVAVLAGGGRASAAEDHPAQTQAAQQTQQPQSGQSCILFIICTSSSPTPSPTASKTSGPGRLPVPSVLPSTGSVVPTSVGGLGSAGVGAGQSGNGKSKAKAKGPNNKAAAGTGGLVVAGEPSVITASSATLDGLAYQGAVNMPVSGGGTVRMMKFTMSSQQLSDLNLTVTGGRLATAASAASFSGDVTLYATRLSGKLAGVPLSLTPGNAESTLLQLLKSLTPVVPVTLTDVTADQPVVLGDTGAITSLKVTAG